MDVALPWSIWKVFNCPDAVILIDRMFCTHKDKWTKCHLCSHLIWDGVGMDLNMVQCCMQIVKSVSPSIYKGLS